MRQRYKIHHNRCFEELAANRKLGGQAPRSVILRFFVLQMITGVLSDWRSGRSRKGAVPRQENGPCLAWLDILPTHTSRVALFNCLYSHWRTTPFGRQWVYKRNRWASCDSWLDEKGWCCHRTIDQWMRSVKDLLVPHPSRIRLLCREIERWWRKDMKSRKKIWPPISFIRLVIRQ